MGEPTSLADFERLAREKTKADEKLFMVWTYINLASGDRQTHEDSKAVFKRWRFQPRILTARPQQSLWTTVLGCPIEMPVGIAPLVDYKFLHQDGTLGAGRAAARSGTLMILSSLDAITTEEFATGAPKDGHYWAQTYLFRDRRNTLNLVRNAEKYGFRAIVVTVDSPVDEHKDSLMNLDTYNRLLGEQVWAPNVRYLEGEERDMDKKISVEEFWGDVGKREAFCHADWEDLAWLKHQTKLPIVLKGVLTGDSARRAAEFGVAGIIVSAHGGRQLDSSPAPLDALPDVVKALRGTNVEVYMDGGIRSGNDVVKALALGARAVFIGRPILYGAAVDGEEGVYKVLQILKSELGVSMALNGCSTLREVTRSIVKHETEFVPKM